MTDAATLMWRQFRFERRMFWRNPSAAFFNFVLPLLFLILIASVFGLKQKDLDVLIPGIAGLSLDVRHADDSARGAACAKLVPILKSQFVRLSAFRQPARQRALAGQQQSATAIVEDRRGGQPVRQTILRSFPPGRASGRSW